MDKSFLNSVPEYHAGYVALAENLPLDKAFENSLKRLRDINVQAIEAKGKETYAPGKWTLHDIIQHLSDCERIFCYRALRFARGDAGPLIGFNQEEFALSANATSRTITDLLDEYRDVHQGSARLFSTFDEKMLLRSGICSGMNLSVLAIGYIILGHQLHHFNIIREKYRVSLF